MMIDRCNGTREYANGEDVCRRKPTVFLEPGNHWSNKVFCRECAERYALGLLSDAKYYGGYRDLWWRCFELLVERIINKEVHR